MLTALVVVILLLWLGLLGFKVVAGLFGWLILILLVVLVVAAVRSATRTT